MYVGMVTLTSEGHAQKLQDELSLMRDRHALCDLTIQVSGGVEYAVHKTVMVAHSRYFRLEMDCGRLRGNTHTISGIDASMLTPLLTYLYTGQLHITSSNIWAIITAATQLDIPGAINLCEHYLQNPVLPQSKSKDSEEMLAEPDDPSHTHDVEDEITAMTCSGDSCDVSTGDENRDSLYTISPKPKQARNACEGLKLRITKRKLSIATNKTHCALNPERVGFKAMVNADGHQNPESEEFNETPKIQKASQNIQKELNFQKVVLPKKKIEELKNSVKNKMVKTFSTATHRQWIYAKKEKLQCKVCGKLFTFHAMLFLHQKRHMVQKDIFLKVHRPSSRFFERLLGGTGVEYKCRLCPDSQRLWTLACAHQCKVHAAQHLFTCVQCQQRHASSNDLHLHMVCNHGAPSHTPASQLYRCSKCLRTFRYCRNFIEHIRVSHNPGLQCENCSFDGKSMHALSKHFLICYRITKSTKSVSRVEPQIVQGGDGLCEMRCAFCGRLFKYQKAYCKHRESCSLTKDGVCRKLPKPEELHECGTCQDQFATIKKLREHCTIAHCKAQFCKKPMRRAYAKRCTTWVCEVDKCGFKLSNPHALTKHVKQHHPSYTLTCKNCCFTAGSRVLLERHFRIRHMRRQECEVCGSKFSVPAQLRVHMYSKHQINDGSVQVYPCTVPGCRYTCVWKSSLKVHMQKHQVEKPFACQICDRRFKREKGLQKHTNKVHRGIRPYMCHVCGQAYGEEAELKAHMMRHSDTKRYKCERCQYETHDKGNYQSHLFGMHQIVISSEMTIFTCNVCDFTTDRKHRYEMHMKTHMGIRDVTCKTCGKTFVTKNTLANHIQRLHSSKTYTCSFCQYATRNQHTFKEHVRVMHTHRDVKPYKCAYCDFRCHTSGNCRKHCANRHKGMEIKWVRLCELYPSGEPPQDESGPTLHPQLQPLAESNIKHISIARRISKDVLNQQQEIEQQQEHQQQQQHQQQQ